MNALAILTWTLVGSVAGVALVVAALFVFPERGDRGGELPSNRTLLMATSVLLMLLTGCGAAAGLLICTIIYGVDRIGASAFINGWMGSGVILMLVLFFALSSIGYAVRRPFSEPARPRRTGATFELVASGLLFGALTATLSLITWDLIAPSLAFAAVAVAIVHVFRIALDFMDAADRLGTRGFRPLAKETKLFSLVFDAAANLCTIWFGIAAIAWNGQRALAWSVAFLGAFMVGKELKYRLWDGLMTRSGARIVSSKGGTRGESRREIRVAQLFFGQFLKSYFYIVVGFALIYLAIDDMQSNSLQWATYGSGGGGFVDAVWLSIGILNSTFPPKLPLAVQVVALFEVAIQPILLGFILAKMLEPPTSAAFVDGGQSAPQQDR